MSIRCIDRVWRHNCVTDPTQLLMLLAIADYAHDDGAGAYPSLSTLADKCRISRRQAVRVVKALEEKGEVAVDRGAGPNGVNLYTVLCSEEDVGDDIDVTPTDSDILSPHDADVTSPHDTDVMSDSDTDVIQSVSQPSDEPHVVPASTARANFAALAEVCQIDLGLITPTQRGKLNQVEKLLRTKKGVKPADVEAFGHWWRTQWWKGKNGQPPRPMQVREDWPKFEQWQKVGGNGDGALRIKV